MEFPLLQFVTITLFCAPLRRVWLCTLSSQQLCTWRPQAEPLLLLLFSSPGLASWAPSTFPHMSCAPVLRPHWWPSSWHPNLPPINYLNFSPPLPIHVSSHELGRRETEELWWLRRHSTFWAGSTACAGVQRGLSVGKVSSWRGWEHEAKNGRKLDVVCKLGPHHHTDTINKLPLCSSDSIKVTELNIESELIGM